MQKIKKIDVFSLILGIFISLAAQGIWNVTVDYVTGKVLDFYVELILVLIVIGLILNLIMYYILFIHVLPIKKEKGKGDSTLSHDQIRNSILSVLYKKAETNPKDASVGVKEINEVVNVDRNVLDFNLIYLEQEKLIESVAIFDNKRIEPRRITSSGINVIEHKEENKNRFPFLNATIPIQIQNKIGLVNIG
ncbi:MAG: hypothetical protein ABSF44_03040 [Candidatus Bathyarchaeia archaeon]|jgi:predicted transcriptional regulator